MNIAFFLLPKRDVVIMPEEATVRQTLERMEHHRYTAVPIVSASGEYKGTVTEGDLLWFIRSRSGPGSEGFGRAHLSEVPLRVNNKPVRIDANMVDLISLAKTQNFVPVVDDMNKFIGIVRRSDIIDYCEKRLFADSRSEKQPVGDA